MTRVLWHDLLGVPWRLHGTSSSGMDCSTVAEEVLRRAGKAPPPSSPYRLADSAGDHSEIATFLSLMDGGFERLGDQAQDATVVGDLVLARDENGIGRHLYILVEPDRGTFLTATHNHGVLAVRRFTINDVLGVYRLKEPPQ
jgi:cell wall-associated NlpC family hydrolase